MATKLKLVADEDTPQERVYGSHRFLALTRNPALQSPRRFERTEKREGDVVL